MDEKEINVNEKNNKVLIIVIVILVLIIIGMGLYIAYDKGMFFSSTDKEIKESKKTKQIDKSKKTEDNEVKELDITKCINNNDKYSNATDKEENVGLSMTINSDKRSVTLNIDWSKFGPLSTASAYPSSVESYQIKGFTKDVQSVFVGEVGQDSMGITLFYLMDDKTVEYTPMFIQKTDSKNNTYYEMNYTYNYAADNSISEQYFMTKGALNGIDDVIKLYTASRPDGITTIGAKADGSFYDLGIAIK